MTFLTAKPLTASHRAPRTRRRDGAAAARCDDAGTRARAAPVHRFQTFYVPNGMAMEYWLPKTAGADFELTPILEPLAPFRDQMLVLSGLKANWNYIHAGASGSFLTGTTRGGRNEVEIIADVSMDQLLARHFASETQVASLELAMDPANNAGACTGNLSCVYTHTLSWRSKTQPLPMEFNPRAVFEKLFGDSGSTDRAAREARLRQHKSILDSVNDKLASLKRRWARRIRPRSTSTPSRSAMSSAASRRPRSSAISICRTMDQPQGVPPVFEDHLDLMLDLQVLAFQSDLTRVISFMISKEQSARPYPQIGVPEAHHPLSHHGDQPELIARMSKINRYHTRVVCEVPRQTAGDTGWRRLAAGSHDDPLRLGHLEQQPPFRRQPADSADGRRRAAGSRAGATSPTPTSRRWRTCWSR